MLLTSFLNATEPVWPVDNVTLQAIHQRPMIENVKQSWISIHFARHFDSRPFESSSSKMRLLDPGRSHFLLSFCGSRTIWYVTGSAIVVVIYRLINVKSKFYLLRDKIRALGIIVYRIVLSLIWLELLALLSHQLMYHRRLSNIIGNI